MNDDKDLTARIDDLTNRFESLERRVSGAHGNDVDNVGAESANRYCTVPQRPVREFAPEVSDDRARAILAIGNKWVNKTELKYYFFDSGPFAGDSAQQAVVRDAFGVWKNIGMGLRFTEVSLRSEAELRIGFLRDDGAWSTVGTGALRRGQAERTMNFGWRIDVPGPNGLDTAVHEIGHALGLHHEHQNPNAGIVWNEEAVYDYFRRTQTPPWSRAVTDFNILDKIDPQTVGGTDWDPDSIMHYSFAPGLIQSPARYRTGLSPAPDLSQQDIEVIQRFYPDLGTATVVPELKPWESQRLSLAPGEQKDFNVLPTETRNYDIRTFGYSDTVMVLFEEDAGDFRYVEGDDDSGWNRNASFTARLIRGRRYQLRIRLYYSTSSGDTAVMMW